MNDLPYNAEYAKSSRASCKGCKQPIGKDTLRVGIMVQSHHFDGKMPMWHHAKCFLKKKLTGGVENIANYNNLRFEDQKMLQDGMSGKAGPQKNSSKKAEGATDFSIEYSKSSRAACKVCSDKIKKGDVRISKIITDTPEAHRFGPMPGWHHVDCFVKARVELEFTDSAKDLPGFKKLDPEDQSVVLEKIPKLGVKRRAEPPAVPAKKVAAENKVLKAQSDLLFSIRDEIQANLSIKEMKELLQYNNQHVSSSEQHLRDNLADCLAFGAIVKCPECKDSTPRFAVDAYRCNGDLTEWTKCLYVSKNPARKAFKIPKEYKENYDFLKKYKYVKRDRVFPVAAEAASSSNENKPLSGNLFMVFGKFQITKAAMEKRVSELGGLVANKMSNNITCCISTEDEVTKNGKNVVEACRLDIHIVSPKFLEDVKKDASIPVAIKDNLICNWGGEPIQKFGAIEELKSKKLEKMQSHYVDPLKSSTVKISVKGGAAVDPDSGMEDNCSVYQKKGDIYNAVLGKVDVAVGLNTFYKLQVLENNSSKRYYLFRSWGRVGTTIGGNKLDNFSKADEAVSEFERLYSEKTGNDWKARANFVKKPGALYPLDIDYGQSLENIEQLRPGLNSKLPKAIQDLICLIFDVELMKKTMLQFEIDLKKMPLGKLSKKQIEKAYSVLSEAQQVLTAGSSHAKTLDATNRFYTLIPHDFGMKQPPLLNNEELIKSKIEMLDSLLEIEVAYSLLKGEENSIKDPVDEHYEKLNTDIEVLDESCDEFQKINTYLANTHAETHNQYKLELNRVFKINRHGENERYQKFKSLHNKKLLWHGSRLTNYVGILSQGLRIAPPEAPCTGYMFGKGVYFADMVSKSANYCFTTRKNPTGLLLLCEVALGDMYERTHADFIQALPANTHSTKGCGMTIPDPKEKSFIGDVEIPYGKPVKSDVKQSSLLYNEYIVYDINQVNIKYLLDVKFKWRS